MGRPRFEVIDRYSPDSRRVWFYVREINRASHNDFLRDKRGRPLRFASRISAEKRAVEILA